MRKLGLNTVWVKREPAEGWDMMRMETKMEEKRSV